MVGLIILGLKYDVNHYLSLFTNFSKTWRAPVIDEQYEVHNIVKLLYLRLL